MCCYCRDVHASWTVGDLNSTRRWHIYQHSVSGRDFCWLFWTAAPLPQVQIQNLGWALRLCLWFFLFPLLKGVTESLFIPMCCLSCASFSLLSPCSCFLCLLLCWPTRVAAFIWDWGRETRRRAASMNPLTSSSSSGMFGCPTPRSSQLSLRIQTPNIFYLPEDFFLAAPWALLLQSQILLRYFSYCVSFSRWKETACLLMSRTNSRVGRAAVLWNSLWLCSGSQTAVKDTMPSLSFLFIYFLFCTSLKEPKSCFLGLFFFKLHFWRLLNFHAIYFAQGFAGIIPSSQLGLCSLSFSQESSLWSYLIHLFLMTCLFVYLIGRHLIIQGVSFFPDLLASWIFGCNFGHMLQQTEPLAIPVLCVCLGIGAGGQQLELHRKQAKKGRQQEKNDNPRDCWGMDWGMITVTCKVFRKYM